MQQPLPDAPSNLSLFTRARTRSRNVVVATTTAIVVALIVALAATTPGSSAAAGSTTRPAAPIPAVGASWFALGASLPWYQRGCDFGCGAGRGVQGTTTRLEPILRTMSRRGVRVVRWELFPSQAWQVRRDADGTPSSLAPEVLEDLDAAVALARRHDLYLLPVVFPDPDRLLATWFTDDAQSAKLAAVLRPMFARYSSEPHVLGWELVSRTERVADQGNASSEQLRRHARNLVRALELVAPNRLAFAGPSDVSRIDVWTGLGFDAFDPHDPAGSTGDACASCRTAADVRKAEGADAPIMIGAFDVATQAEGIARLDAYVRNGYGGALAWSWRGIGYPDHPERTTRMPDVATWNLHYAQPNTGPRARPLNPCYGPRVKAYLCPNLQMGAPANFFLGRRGGRTVLFSRNSINSRGIGPASLHGVRNGRYTMAARQVIHLRNGRTELIPTGAKLLFKAIPGQYRYWKWNGAARMELWRLDSTGRAVTRVRVGPKTVYCLRDLKRTAPAMSRSPRGMVFPGCSQRLSQRSVTLGTSVGWSDIYPSTYHENWVDVTGLRGCFAYVHIADPTNVIYESNEDDNTSQAVVKLPFTGSNRGCPGARPLPTVGETGTY
ncbi:MAG: hypothetical protein KDC46_01560 [Thermoleophilia bacterium]|nr:hypothetical protein [Thermoleophilia bacterium]